MTRFLKALWGTLAALIIFFAIIFTAFRAVTPWVAQYKPQIEQRLSTFLKSPVHIRSIKTGWYWFTPVIKLDDLKISESRDEAVEVDKLWIGVNLFQSLWHWQLKTSLLYVRDLHLTLSQARDQWVVHGLHDFGKKSQKLEPRFWQPAMAWLLDQKKIIFKRTSLNINLKDKSHFLMHIPNVTMVQRFGRYRLRADADLLKPKPVRAQLFADITSDVENYRKSSGHAYLAVQQLPLLPLQRFVKTSPIVMKSGEGDLRLWLDWQQGLVEKAQGSMDFNQVDLKNSRTKQEWTFPKFAANLAFKQSANNWELTADQLHMSVNDTKWPENKLLLRYQRDSKTLETYLEHINLAQALAIMPKEVQGFVAWFNRKPHGDLQDLELTFKNRTLDAILARFLGVGWQATAKDKLPGMENLSGVLQWQANHGRLDLDSEKVVVTLKNKAPLVLDSLNASLNWQEQQQGLSLTIDRFGLRHPHLVANVNGVLTSLSKASLGDMDLKVALESNKAEYWLAYIPEQAREQRLAVWLRESIKKVDHLLLDCRVKGKARDFPFDEGQGELSMKGRVSGMDFVFAPHWPLTKDFDASLRLDKRRLSAEVVRAQVVDAKVDNAHLEISQLGTDKEMLSFRSHIDTPMQNVLAYVLASPLQQKFAFMRPWKAMGDIKLNLDLILPLYPDDTLLAVNGDLSLLNNSLTIKQGSPGFSVDAISGRLRFDKHSVTEGQLRASIMERPFTVVIASHNNPITDTTASIEGTLGLGALRHQLDISLLDLVQGDLKLNGELHLPRLSKETLNLKLSSTLEGVAIQLPPPFGKDKDTKANFDLTAVYQADNHLQIQTDYDSRVRTKLLFSALNHQLNFDKGLVFFGNTEMPEPHKAGLQVKGVLPNLNLTEWRDFLAALPISNLAQMTIDATTLVDVLLKQAIIAGRTYQNLNIKLKPLAKNDWSIGINQEDVVANLRYQSGPNLISGVFTKLNLKKMVQEVKGSKIKPGKGSMKDIPNLSLEIKGLQWDTLKLGDLNFKTTSGDNVWHLDSLNLTTPYYQVMAKGEWTNTEAANKSSLEATMVVNDLARALSFWDISPVVFANKGNLQFQGTWSGPFYDFSLSQVSGQLSLLFKNGRITNLSPEMEAKLGLGKLLSILSLQTIPRRLQLDFSDLANKGYSFDEFKGDFSLKEGSLRTENSYIEGPIAYASMRGSLDVVKQLYNLDLEVTPHIAASLPVMATIAGGPVAGVATWLASKIINKGVQKVSGYSYKITGPWKQPVVEQVRIDKQKKG